MPLKCGIVLVIIIVGKCVLGRIFLSGTSDFGKVERTSAMIFRVRDCISDSAKNIHISASRYTFPEWRRFEIRILQCVAKFGVDYYKDVYS